MKCNGNYFNIADNYRHFVDIQCGTTLRRNSIKDSKTVYKEWEKKATINGKEDVKHDKQPST